MPYDHAALEPYIDARTMMLHHDVWEHAYYLKHENGRGDYLKGWWSVVNWQEAARRYERSDHSAEQRWEADGGAPAPGAIKSQLS